MNDVGSHRDRDDTAADGVRALPAAIALLLFVAGRCLVPMDETDLFYNLRLGEIILGTHSVPRQNLLSFTYPDFPDPNLAWLFQIVLALVHRASGIAGTVVLKTTFVVATFALLFRVALRRGAHPAVAAAVLALAAWTAEPRFVERPHLVTFLGLAILLLALARAEHGRTRLLWAMLPLGLPWANGNSCFFLAPAILLLYAGGALLDFPDDRTHARRAGTLALLLIPLLFATPTGSGWLGYVANHFRMPHLRPLQEYRTAQWPVDAPYFFLLIAVIAGAMATRGKASAPISWKTLRLRELLPILALALLGARRIRFVAEFALLAGPYVAARATAFLRQGFQSRPPRTTGGPGGKASAVVALALIFLTVAPRIQAVAQGQPFVDLGIEEGLVPTAAVAWLNQRHLRDRLYNDLEVGSYLTWDGWPRHRVFQDPRINGYPAELHALLRRSDLRGSEWQALLDRFGVQSALITFPELNPRGALFDPRIWALCYRSGEALVFVRRTATHAALIAAEELPISFHYSSSAGINPDPLSSPPETSPVPACEWHRRLAVFHTEQHDLPRAAAEYRQALDGDGATPPDRASCQPVPGRDAVREQAASVELQLGNPQRAANLLQDLPSPTARGNHAFALLQLGRIDQALSAFEAVIQQAPADPEATFGHAVALSRLDRTPAAIQELGAFLDRWPQHFAAPQARALLRALQHPSRPDGN